MTLRLPLAALCLLVVPGCLSGLRPDPPQTIRYYSAAPDGVVEPGSEAAAASPLRLRRVRAADHLGTRMVWRTSSIEYGFHELSRWTEPPEAYLMRHLEQALYTRRGVPRSNAASAAVLDAELIAFEQDLGAAKARVAVAFVLGRGSEVLWSETVERDVPIEGDAGSAVAGALRQALDEVAAKSADRVVQELGG